MGKGWTAVHPKPDQLLKPGLVTHAHSGRLAPWRCNLPGGLVGAQVTALQVVAVVLNDVNIEQEVLGQFALNADRPFLDVAKFSERGSMLTMPQRVKLGSLPTSTAVP